MYYIQFGLVVLACVYAMPLIATLMQDAETDDRLHRVE